MIRTTGPALIRIALCIALMLASSAIPARETITVGILSYRPADVILTKFRPLVDYLSAQIGQDVRLQALSLDDMNLALTANQLDFFLTSPSHFLVIRNERSVTGVVATLLRQSGATSTASYGGLIVARQHRHDLNRLEDLQGRVVASPGVLSLGGYQSQLLELMEAGIDLRDDSRVKLLGSHDRVVHAVLAGDVDAGFIRTGVLEQMMAESPRQVRQLKIIHPQKLTGFPFALSTRLYPEWPLVALPHVEPAVVRRLAAALFTLDSDHPAARSAGIGGFAPPADYRSVELLARRLEVAPYDRLPTLTWLDSAYQYRFWVLAVALLLTCLLMASIWLGRNRRQLSAERRRLRQLILDWPQPMLLIREGSVLDSNEAAVALLRFRTREAFLRQSLVSCMPPLQPDGRSSADAFGESMARVRAGAVEAKPWLFRCADGSDLWVDMSLAPVHQETRRDNVILCALHDITMRRQAQQRERLAAGVFDHAREGIFIADEHGMILDVNAAFVSITGLKATQVKGRLPPLPLEEDPGILLSARERGDWSGEFEWKRSDGKPLILTLNVSSVCGEYGEAAHFVGIFSDITARKDQENRLRTLAYYDALTRLPNRSLFIDRLQQTMAQARRQGDHLAMMVIDIDRFAVVNELYGHRCGDALLVEIAGRVRLALREEDTLARLGGDEFAAIIVNVHDRSSLDSLLKRVLADIAEPVWVADHMLEVSGSIGVVLYPQQDEQTADQLQRQAEQAMLQAKQAGRNGYCLFEASGIQA